MIYKTNQTAQFYVAKSVKTLGTNEKNSAMPAKMTTAGDIAVMKDGKGNMYFEYKGADTLMRSDLIPINKVIDFRYTAASSMAVPLKRTVINLNSSLNEGKPIYGQEYILRIRIENAFSQGTDVPYIKEGVVYATADVNSESVLLKKMAISLAKNFSRETYKFFKFFLSTAAVTNATEQTAMVEVTKTTKESDLTGTYKYLVIDTTEPMWELGRADLDYTIFRTAGLPVTYLGVEEQAFNIVETNSNVKVANGKEIASMEYYYMTFRGDMYKMNFYPNIVPTKYLVDETSEYDVINIHYAYAGDNDTSYLSEKDIIIVGSSTIMTSLKTNIISVLEGGKDDAVVDTTADPDGIDN